VPAHVEATGPAEGDAPPVPCKPGVLFGRLPQGNRTGTGTEGVEIEFDAREGFKKVCLFLPSMETSRSEWVIRAGPR
jgi:hypothetical protein